MHNDRLKDAVLPNVLGKFTEPCFRELCARVANVFVQSLNGDEERLPGNNVECRGVARGREGQRTDIKRIDAGLCKPNRVIRRSRCRIKQIQLLAL
jgi:hypothetical protein